MDHSLRMYQDQLNSSNLKIVPISIRHLVVSIIAAFKN